MGIILSFPGGWISWYRGSESTFSYVNRRYHNWCSASWCY